MNAYALEPQDLLFFRDGRPIATAGGHGARWPEPSVVFDAIHAALHRAFPESTAWEHVHRFGRSGDRDPQRNRTQRFGSLTTAGLFPIWTDGRWLFPAPADAHPDPTSHEAEWLLRPVRFNGRSNLPGPFLKYITGNYAIPTKETPAPWWTTAAWTTYLDGKRPDLAELFYNQNLFDAEWATGIGVDPETQTQDGERIYSVEYLRLRPRVRCGFLASLPMKHNDADSPPEETIQNLFTVTNIIIVGGQQRPCRVELLPQADRSLLPMGTTGGFPCTGGKYRVKWTLLSPAIWPEIRASADNGIPSHPGGWLPNWICAESGKVLLRHRHGTVRRVWDEHRKRTVRRAEGDSCISAHLVGACVPKPVPVTGWTQRLHLIEEEQHWKLGESGRAHGPRCTHLAVPGGAVYYFEADSLEAAETLAAVLNWHGATTTGAAIKNRRSTLMGEKGFGLGVCSTWSFFGT